MDRKEQNIKAGKNRCRKIASTETTFHIVVDLIPLLWFLFFFVCLFYGFFNGLCIFNGFLYFTGLK